MRHYCTLFDHRYLSRGLALHASLVRHAQPFTLHVYAFSAECERVLRSLALPQVRVFGFDDFETPQLLALKAGRTAAEYCWTCTPVILEHSLQEHDLPECTYLDADLYFFSDPEPIFAEMGAASSLITPHGFSPQYAEAIAHGKYCVQFMPFRNDARGRAILSWWRERCIEWCHARVEDGKFGDQLYLEDWLDRFDGVVESQHIGCGAAPWNIQRFALAANGAGLELSEGATRAPLVFYHFHGMQLHDRGGITLSRGYELDREVQSLIYRPYLKELREIGAQLAARFPGFDPHGRSAEPAAPRHLRRRIQTRWFGRKNYYPASALSQPWSALVGLDDRV